MDKATPSFADVASFLAKPLPPPEWVIPVLEHFADLVGAPRDDDDTIERKLLRSAEYLDRYLPMHVMIAERVGDEIPDCIETILPHLQDLIPFLAANLLDKGEGSPNRRLCAAVCAEIWRTLHGAIQPHSLYLQKACDEYWRACGQEPIGRKHENEPRNWERHLLWAEAADDEGFQSQIEQFRHGLSHTKPAPK
jgi:hypothetical protein